VTIRNWGLFEERGLLVGIEVGPRVFGCRDDREGGFRRPD
jgi:hypothetical protein